MKQQVNPVVAGICVVVVLVILIFVGMKVVSPSAPTDVVKPSATASKPAEINGHPVPNNVPYDYMQKQAQGAGGGPAQMPHP